MNNLKTKKIDLHSLRNDEHFQFNTEFRDSVVAATPAALKIQAQYDTYLPLYEQEDEVLKKIMKSVFTEDINAADHQRDITFRGMIDANHSALKHFNARTQTAAKRLKIVFDTYGNVAKKPINEETSAIYNLLQELRGNYAADVATVNIADWATELEANNLALENLVKNRYDESAAKTDLVLKQVRLQVDAAYHAIVERLDALSLVEGTPVYETFIHSWNVVVEKYNDIAAQRHGRNVKKSPSSPQPPPKEGEADANSAVGGRQ
jgi:hypothetical protein